MNRRGILGLGAGLLALPALAHAGVLMPVRLWKPLPILRVSYYDALGRVLHRVDAEALAVEFMMPRDLVWHNASADVLRLPGFQTKPGVAIVSLALGDGRPGFTRHGTRVALAVQIAGDAA